MPLTPFHFGPALLLSGLAGRRLDLPTLLVGSVIVDVRAALVIFGPLGPPVHGVLTTVLGGAAVAILLALVVGVAYTELDPVLELRGPDWDWSPATVLAGALVGVWSHVVLDAILYADARPLTPLDGNPFLGLVSSTAVYGICVVAGVVGLGLVGLRIVRADERW